MNILFCTSEYFPLLKTGGLADVASALPQAWANAKQRVSVVLPAYTNVLEQVKTAKSIGTITTPFANQEVEILLCEDFLPVSVVLVKCTVFENRSNPYVDEKGNDWSDNLNRFALFSFVCASLTLPKNILNIKFDIAVSNDWQTGLLQAYMHLFKSQSNKHKCIGVHIIHNIAFPGIFPAIHFLELHLPKSYFHLEGLEYYGQISLQKAALQFAHAIFTVSPNYAKEIMHSHEFGMGFEGLLQHKNNLTGILNGVDTTQWNPETDAYIQQQYNHQNIEKKQVNKFALQDKFKLTQSENRLLIGIVSRLTSQKGFDIFIHYVTKFGLNKNIDFVMLGTGDKDITALFKIIAQNYANFKFIEAYSESLSHDIIAGVDALLIPSKFEPCGLTQLYAMAYGTVPLVHPTGGLKDSVIPYSTDKIKATGFYLNALEPKDFADLFEQTQQVFDKKKQWEKIMLNGMNQDFSWHKTQKAYLQVFKQIQ